MVTRTDKQVSVVVICLSVLAWSLFFTARRLRAAIGC